VTTAAAAHVLDLPEAGGPPEARGLTRDGVRLLVAGTGEPADHRFRDLPGLLSPGDLLLVNTSRTLPAALPARRTDGSPLDLHLSTPVPAAAADRRLPPRASTGRSLPGTTGDHWVVELRRAGARVRDARAGERLSLPGGAAAELLAPHLGTRLWVARLELGERLVDYLDRHGAPIRYRHTERAWPLEAYQNVYATEPGSAEMPSAGRPFTAELITRLVAAGVDVAPLVLHTGVSSLERGESPYPERFEVPAWTAERVNLARALGGRAIAVGTTAVRAIESAADERGRVRAAAGWTDLVIGPERPIRALDGVLTGFHDSDSSHLQLLEQVAGRTALVDAYRSAGEGGYLRHEFGDLLLLLR
jgi:S-adenosylmethionine:tRNA ribosyltransferase-isomerase